MKKEKMKILKPIIIIIIILFIIFIVLIGKKAYLLFTLSEIAIIIMRNLHNMKERQFL